MPEHAKCGPGAVAWFWVRLACFALLALAALAYGAYVLTPKDEYGVCPMTNLYVQPRDTVDVLVTGTSLAYSGCNTNVLWRQFGIASYNLCGAEQPFWETYYQLKEALGMQRPKVVLLDVKAASYTKRQYSTRARTIQHTFGILDPISRISAIFGCQESPRKALDFVLAYPQVHANYVDRKWEDFTLLPTNQGRGPTWKGFIETDLEEAHDFPYVSSTSKTKKITDRSEQYVRKIIELCQAEGIPLKLICFPFPDYGNDQLYYNYLWQIAAEYDVPVKDYNDPYLTTGLDYTFDFADYQHLNIRGGMKFALLLGNDLKTEYDLPDHRGDPYYASYDTCAQLWYAKLDGFTSKPMNGTTYNYGF